MPQGRTQSPPKAVFVWVWTLMVSLPFFGFLVGVMMIQEQRHAKDRGNPRSSAQMFGVLVLTLISFALTVIIVLLMTVS